MEKEDNKEEEETNTNFEDEDKEKGKENVKEEEKGREGYKKELALNVLPGNPRKRKVDQALLQEDTNAHIFESPSPISPISPPKEMI